MITERITTISEIISATHAVLIFLLFIGCNQKEEKKKPLPYTQEGEASYYARMLEGNKTANGEIYYSDSLTAAHNTLPLGTVVKVTNLTNNKDVEVRINDRGPYSGNRIIDLSQAAAEELEMINSGLATVKIEVITPAPGYSISDSVIHL